RSSGLSMVWPTLVREIATLAAAVRRPATLAEFLEPYDLEPDEHHVAAGACITGQVAGAHGKVGGGVIPVSRSPEPVEDHRARPDGRSRHPGRAESRTHLRWPRLQRFGAGGYGLPAIGDKSAAAAATHPVRRL